MARKYARIFVRGHYLFSEANSFPRAKFQENCELQGIDIVQGQISEHIFAAKLRLLCLLSISFKNWGISSDKFDVVVWQIRQNIAPKSVPHVQHDYCSSFNQSSHWFVALSLTLPSSNLKLPKILSKTRSFSYLVILGLVFSCTLIDGWSNLMTYSEFSHRSRSKATKTVENLTASKFTIHEIFHFL